MKPWLIAFAWMFAYIVVMFGLQYHKERLRYFQQEAFERGHMVECVGVTGYHWECE